MDLESTRVATDGRQWQKDLPELGDLEVLVAPWENRAYEDLQQKLISALPPALRADGRVKSGPFYIIQGKCIARTLLFDWKNFKLGGKDVAFDAKYAETVLIDPKYRPLRDGIIAAAKRVQLGVKEDDEAIEGNSGASSSGAGSGEAAKTD
jgi:hypothetical protein